MKKFLNYLPFLTILLLPLLFYYSVDTSGWKSSGDIHAFFEFASALLAITAGIMVLLHFFTTGRWFFLIISIGFVLIGAEEFVHAIFSFNRIWTEIHPTFKLAISTTWLTGHFILLTSFFSALVLGNKEVAPAKRGLNAVVYNILGLLLAVVAALLIFNMPFLPNFVQLGSLTKKLFELSIALLYFVAFLFYSHIYIKQQSHSPLLWSITAFLVFRVLAHIFVFDSMEFYDAHWDAAHLIVFLSYFFPIFGIWGETLKLHRSADAQLIELEKEMTERKQAEKEIQRLNAELEQRVRDRTAELEAANKELEAFSYSVSHDLRAPLRHIDGYVDLLVSRCRDGLTDKGLHYVETIADSARQMGVLIDNLLQFSRTGRAEMHRERLDMNQALKEALTLLQETNAGRAIQWVIGELPSVQGDYAMLHQVWINLLDNALKYTRTREMAKIEVGARKEDGETLFFIRDNGVGFDMRHADKLFGVFQRLHPLEEFEGTGIGLANVKRIITRHGGRIWAEAELDQGATFYFTLPKFKGAQHA